jgi:CPA1 family monovalent cation:H+ antiporter
LELHGVELIIVLLAIVVGLAVIADRVHIPYPMLLMVAGIAIAFIPGLPPVELEPDLVFLLFLPPVLFGAGYFTSWRDFKANRRPIGLLAIGCVLFTTVIVAVVARWLIPGMGWAPAFVLGAIVSPPDAVAATTMFERLGVPHRVVTVLEGESLVNDASALILYRFAIAAVATGTFSLPDALREFVVLSLGGVVIGIVAGYIIQRCARFARTPSLQISVSLVVPALVYFLAEHLGVSGVLATVAAGIVLGRHSSVALSPEARIGGAATWASGTLIVNALAFVLIGMQLRLIVQDLPDGKFSTLLGQALVISLAVIVVRFIWVYPVVYLPRILSPTLRQNDPAPPWQAPFVIGWSGLRGIVSLASALALPVVMDNGEPFPYRNEILFFSFAVIVVTLLGQGGSLPLVLAKLGIGDDGDGAREVVAGRRVLTDAALARLEAISGESWVPEEHANELRSHLLHKREFNSRDQEEAEEHARNSARLRLEINEAARQALIAARNSGQIGDGARVVLETELDIERLRNSY